MATIWAGIDAGKTHHHCVAIDEGGRQLLSRRVTNDEPELLELLADVLGLGDEVTWGIDLADDGAALAIAILINHSQSVRYISGRAIHRASEGYRGEERPTPRTPPSSLTRPAFAAICTPYAPATRPSPTSGFSPTAARTWSLTAPGPSTGSVPSSPAFSPAWNGPWTSPTQAR